MNTKPRLYETFLTTVLEPRYAITVHAILFLNIELCQVTVNILSKQHSVLLGFYDFYKDTA